jgi:peptidoglycan-N-acetylglucosamine deacetylase
LAFDNTLARSTSLDGTARTKMLIRNMARADVKQAMFLIKARTITPNTIDRLAFYDESGQLLVNAGHSYSMELRQKSYGYPIDIMKANAALEPYANYHKHVNFPYLYGETDPELLAQLQSFLAEHQYLPTYTTTYVHDEYMDYLYQQRILAGRPVDIRQLERAYTKMIVDEVMAYDAKAHMFLGFSPRQVLLLHENDLAAYCIVGAIDALNAKGFKVIAPEKVFTDPVSNPYFVSGFSAVSYMPYLIGMPDDKPIWLAVASQKDKEKIHTYLREQGLESVIPQ